MGYCLPWLEVSVRPNRKIGFRHAVVTVLSSSLVRCRPWEENLMLLMVRLLRSYRARSSSVILSS